MDDNIMHSSPKTATTIKLPVDLYNEFKFLCLKNKITLQTLVERATFRYVHEDKFQSEMDKYRIPTPKSQLVPTISEPEIVLSPEEEQQLRLASFPNLIRSNQ